jgi:hypothetical protein
MKAIGCIFYILSLVITIKKEYKILPMLLQASYPLPKRVGLLTLHH